jgi:hypothetical protein
MKVIDHKKIDITDEEYEYYKEIVKYFTKDNNDGTEFFHDLFDVDSNGFITIIKPKLSFPVPWAVLFFLQQVMISQRLRLFDNRAKEQK